MPYKARYGGHGPGVNITPLVNVALVLLIIFMVVTPMIREGIQVNLPPAEHGTDSSREEEGQVVVTVDDEGAIHVNLKRVSPSELERELLMAFRGREDKPIVIKGDRTLHYGQILEVMYLSKKIGATEVELVAEKGGGS